MHRPKHYRGGFQISGLVQLARELRQAETSAEDLLWTLLRNRRLLGFKFRRQHQIGTYIADFYCRDAELVVECDGSVHDSNEQWQHDQGRDIYLRFANADVLKRPEWVVE